MTTRWMTILLLSFSVAGVCQSDDAPSRENAASPKVLGFLDVGSEYSIRFALPNHQFFPVVTADLAAAQYGCPLDHIPPRSESGRCPDCGIELVASESTIEEEADTDEPLTAEVPLERVPIQVFAVRAAGEGAWVLLERPESINDAEAWNSQRLATAQLTPARIQVLSETEAGQEELRTLRQLASRNTSTSTTWVNFDHAIAVRKLPSGLSATEVVARSTRSNVRQVKRVASEK